MKKKYIHLITGILFTLIFIYFSYKNIGILDISQIWDYPVSYGFAGISVFLFILAQYFRAMAWSEAMEPTLLRSIVFKAVCIGNATNMVLPFRMGEVARIFVLTSKGQKNYGKTGIHLVLERILDILILGILAISTSFLFTIQTEMLKKIQILKYVLLLGMILAFLFLFILRWMIKKEMIFNKKLNKLILFLKQFRELQSFEVLLKTMFFIFISWTCVYLSTVFGVFSVGINGKDVFLISLFVLVLTNLGMLIPAAPGGVGVFQYAALYAFSLFQVGIIEATILSILLHLIQYIALIPLGIYFFIKGQYSFKNIYELSSRDSK